MTKTRGKKEAEKKPLQNSQSYKSLTFDFYLQLSQIK